MPILYIPTSTEVCVCHPPAGATHKMSTGTGDAASSTPETTTHPTTMIDAAATTSMPPLTSPGTMSPSDTPVNDVPFVQTTAAQAIAGAFVWAALLITCHQVSWWLKVQRKRG